MTMQHWGLFALVLMGLSAVGVLVFGSPKVQHACAVVMFLLFGGVCAWAADFALTVFLIPAWQDQIARAVFGGMVIIFGMIAVTCFVMAWNAVRPRELARLFGPMVIVTRCNKR